MNYLEGCNDSSNMCKTWIKEAWFPEWCNGKHKFNTAKGYFGGMTLRETCQHSCGGCPAVDANTETNRRKNSTTEYSGLDGLRGRTTVIDENTSTQQLVLTTLTPILTTEVSGRKALEFFNIITIRMTIFSKILYCGIKAVLILQLPRRYLASGRILDNVNQ